MNLYPTTSATPILSVIVPVYNESSVLEEFHRRLASTLATIAMDAEVIYVNDGSRDDSLNMLNRLRTADERISIIDLSRNFGKEIAMTAGFDHAVGDAVVIIDADLQDPPELIVELVEQWRAGYDMVYAQRSERDGETILKKITASVFYRVIQNVGQVRIPRDTGDFRLLSRRAVDALNSLREQHRFMKGLFAWIGFPQTAVQYKRDARFAGETKFNYWKLWNFALEGITSFTVTPLKVASYLGAGIATVAILYALWIFFKTLIFGDPVRGYPSLMVIVSFLGGVQLLFIGLLGEYLGRMFNEVKRRPLYFINRFDPSAVVRQKTYAERSKDAIEARRQSSEESIAPNWDDKA